MATFTNSVSGNENAIVGISTDGRGVEGWSETQYGVAGESKASAGVRGTSSEGRGVEGWSESNWGVAGISKSSIGVHGQSEADAGVYGESQGQNGVLGFSTATGHAGVAGANDDGDGVGVYGRSAKQAGVYGESRGFNGVRGVSYAPGHGAVVGVSEVHNPDPIKHPENNAGPGVYGQSDGTGVWGAGKTWHGVYGESSSSTGGAGVWGEHKANGVGVVGNSQSGVGVWGKGGRLAGFFEGDVEVTGDIRLANADCAEDFDIADSELIEPGTVMVVGEQGALLESKQAYDKRVAGVISGAGSYKPGIVLDKQPQGNRKPIALLGKVYCKVDAQYGAIEVGDLLTTSPTSGHAMKAVDPLKAFGAVIGKALQPQKEGPGLIPILIALQ